MTELQMSLLAESMLTLSKKQRKIKIDEMIAQYPEMKERLLAAYESTKNF